MAVRIADEGESECTSVMDVDIGCVSHIDNITGRESGQTSLGASHERTRGIGS